MKRSSRITVGLCLLLALTALLRAEEPAKKTEAVKPPWQRKLSTTDSFQVSLLEIQVNSLMGLGKFAEAVKPAEQIYNIRRRGQGEGHWETVIAEWKYDVCEKARRKSTKETDRLAWALRTHAFAYADLAVNHNQLVEEEKSLFKALTICEKILGKNHLYVSFIYGNLYKNQYNQEKYINALLYSNKGLDIAKSVLGEEHPETATSYDHVAYSLNALSNYKEAVKFSRKALSIRRKVQGEENKETANSYLALSSSLHGQGKYLEAVENIRNALAIHRKLQGEENKDSASGYVLLADNLTLLGNYKEAEEAFRKALTICRRALGEESIYTASSYNGLAINLQLQGRHKEAEEGFRKAVAINRRVKGEESIYTASSYEGLASHLDYQGKYQEAEIYFRKALAIFRTVLDENHPNTVTCYVNLALNLNRQGRYKEAEDIARKSLAICNKTVDEKHPDTALSYNALAIILIFQGKYSEADAKLRKALAIHHKMLGEEHPYTATIANNLSVNFFTQGKYKVAEERLFKALECHRKVLGEKHPTTARSYNNVAYNLYAQGKYKEAEGFFLRSAESFAKARLHVAVTGLERATFTSQHSPLLSLAAVLARNGKTADAWQRFEESLGRGTLDDFTARLARPEAERDKQTQIDARIDRLSKLIEKVGVAKPTAEQTKQRDEWLGQLRQAYDELAAFTQQLEKKYGPIAGQIYPRAQIQKALPPDAAFVAWLDIAGEPKAADPNGEHWAILLRSVGDPIWVRLSGSGDKDAWTDADTQLPAKLRAALQITDSDWQTLAERLRQQRLQPLAQHLKGVRRLIVLPSTALAGVPVEAFADQYTVSYAHSATMYTYLLQQPAPSGKGLFALAAPVFDVPTQQEKPLPSGGVLLTMVLPRSNAAIAGLKPNDVLLRYGDTDLAGPADIKLQPESKDPEKRVPVIVWREGKKLSRPRFVRPGKLGVVIAQEPAPQALAEQRRLDRLVFRSGEGEKLDRLPCTRIEVASLVPLFDKDTPVQMLLGSDASEQRLNDLAKSGELGKYRYVHLATHGEVNNIKPLFSAVMLSRDRLPDEKQRTELLVSGQPIPDGRLQADEALRRWKLHADLVTLSACQTALGKYERGEGFVGFAQALTLCGTRSVCLSLWKVDDTATALLMERFYQNLLGKRPGLSAPLSKAVALAEAKSWLRTLPRKQVETLAADLSKGGVRGIGEAPLPPLPVPPAAPQAKPDDCPFAHPRYWAAFVLYGHAD